MRKSAAIINIIKTTVILILCGAISAFCLCGCGAAVISCNSDEIKASSWDHTAENGMYAKLDFDEDRAIFTIQNEDQSATIDGLCVIDEKTLIILGADDKYIFDYKLTGSTIMLSYEGKTIELSKT